ncbi:MAG: HAMP domain-containing histidine kinase [Deltaproteobacteria bacterium]|nr:HAMP domain-containing histidine kinase [Deltaproteobacteria bacterium]
MRLNRIALKTFGYGLAMLVIAAIVVMFTVSRAISRRDPQFLQVSRFVVADLARDRDDDDALARSVTSLAQTGVDLTLYDANGGLLISTVSPPLPMMTAAELAQGDQVHRGAFDVAHAIRERGAVVAIGIVSIEEPSMAEFAFDPLLMLLGLLLLLSVAFTVHLVRPLERVAAAAERFGRGDLAARTGVVRTDEIGEVARTFDAMADRVTRLMQAQHDLMANVSHELQTPLARIQVAIDLVQDGVATRAQELLPGIASDVAELERLIEDVMTIARFERADGTTAPLPREPLSVGDLVERARIRFDGLHDSHPLAVEVAPGLPTLVASPVLLRRVLDNLLDNARKYSEPGSEIRLTAAPSATGASVSVVDRGIGMDDADLAQLFTPFFRSDRSRTRATGGVGLGLVLAKRVVEAHGGTIRVSSALGRGTTVTVELPAR